jgi:hypothetical protein
MDSTAKDLIMITIKHIKSFIRNAIHIVQNYQADIGQISSRINLAEKLIRERTDIHTSIGIRTGNFVIVCGKYKNNDYIQTFEVRPNDFEYLVDKLREQRRYGITRILDAPPEFSRAFRREIIDD